jgi:hypothetical protein
MEDDSPTEPETQINHKLLNIGTKRKDASDRDSDPNVFTKKVAGRSSTDNIGSGKL